MADYKFCCYFSSSKTKEYEVSCRFEPKITTGSTVVSSLAADELRMQ